MKSHDWSGLGFNPAPGAAHVVENLVTNMSKLARHLQEVHSVMEGVKDGKDNAWTGEAADAFKKNIGKLPKYLRDASDGASQARKALDGWHKVLVENQPKARDLEARAKAARERAEKAESEERSAQNNPDLRLAGKQVAGDAALEDAKRRYKAASDQLDEAVTKLNSAHDELNDLIRRAHALEDDHKSVAHAKERAIREAADSTADPEWNDLWDSWAGQHGGDLLGVIGGVLGVASVFCPALAPFAVVCSLLALATHTTQYAAQGQLWPPQKNAGNWITLGGDLLGSIPGGKVVGSSLAAAARESGGVRAMMSGADGGGMMSSIQQGVRGGWQGFQDGLIAGKGTIVEDAKEMPWMFRASGASEKVQKVETAVAGGIATGAQVPSLLNESNWAGDSNTGGGALGNVVGGLGDGVHGSAAAVASVAGVGAEIYQSWQEVK